MARAARARRRRDRRRRHQGRRARQGRPACTSPPRASASRIPGVSLGAALGAAGRQGPAFRARSATTASRSCSRAASSTSRPTSAPTPAPCCRWSRRWSRPWRPGHPLDAGSHARRRRHVAQRAGARLRTRASHLVRGADPGARPRCAAPASCSASIRSTSPTRASSSPSSPPDHADRGARGAARGVAGGAEAVIIGEIRERAGRAPCWPAPATAAAGSSTCSWATRCRGSADGRPMADHLSGHASCRSR